MMFVVTVTFQIHPGRMAAFLPLMQDNAQTSLRVEPGCQQFDICREGDRIFLYELYETRAAFDLHLASSHFKTFDAAVADMIATKDVHLFTEVIR